MKRYIYRETERQRQSRIWAEEERKVDSRGCRSCPHWAAPSQGGFLGWGWGL